MKKIKIKFIGFWPQFNYSNNFILNAIKDSFDIELSDTPDYVISSCFSQESLKYENCVRIFYTGENICPDFNIFDYAISYERINFDDRHLYFSDYMIPEEYGTDYNLMLNKHKNVENILKSKTEFCSFVVSKGSGNVMSERELIFNKLSKYKKVNSGGRFLNNIGKPDGVENKLEFQKKHKFSIAFENSSHEGYTTEKIIQSFAAQTIPIYFGDPSISKKFNTKSFVNCHDYSNFDEVVNVVKQIDSNDELYKEMIATPALLSNISIEDENLRLKNFLTNIFSQDFEKAFRRDRVGYGKMYCDYLIKCNTSEKEKKNYFYKFNRKIYHLLKKLYKDLFRKD